MKFLRTCVFFFLLLDTTCRLTRLRLVLAQLTLRQRNVRSPVVIFKMFWGCFFLCDAALLRDVPVARGLRCTEATSAQPCLFFFLGGGRVYALWLTAHGRKSYTPARGKFLVLHSTVLQALNYCFDLLRVYASLLCQCFDAPVVRWRASACASCAATA